MPTSQNKLSLNAFISCALTAWVGEWPKGLVKRFCPFFDANSWDATWAGSKRGNTTQLWNRMMGCQYGATTVPTGNHVLLTCQCMLESQHRSPPFSFCSCPCWQHQWESTDLYVWRHNHASYIHTLLDTYQSLPESLLIAPLQLEPLLHKLFDYRVWMLSHLVMNSNIVTFVTCHSQCNV